MQHHDGDRLCSLASTEKASARMAELLSWGPVNCRASPDSPDRYGRALARCAVGDIDLAETLIVEGLALPYWRYSDDYAFAAWEARLAEAGAWRGEVVPPWVWRQAP